MIYELHFLRNSPHSSVFSPIWRPTNSPIMWNSVAMGRNYVPRTMCAPPLQLLEAPPVPQGGIQPGYFMSSNLEVTPFGELPFQNFVYIYTFVRNFYKVLKTILPKWI